MSNAIDPSTVAVMEYVPVGVAVSDASGRVVWVNSRLCLLLGAVRESLLGSVADELLGARVEAVDEHTRRALLRGSDEQRRWLEQSSAALPDDGGAVHCVSDISAFESRARGRAAVMAGIETSRIDDETGLLNRRATLQELNAQVSRSRRYGNPLSLIGVRVPAASVGHDLGLRHRVAQHLRESLRWVDSAGTLDSDLLVVVLPETELEAARHVADKLLVTLTADADCAAATALAVTGWAQPDDVGALLARLREPLTDAA